MQFLFSFQSFHREDQMPFVSPNYLSNKAAPLGQWACTRTSSLGPFVNPPPEKNRHRTDFCGQCVSFVTSVCPDIPVDTGKWKKGDAVKDNRGIVAGTAIATFDDSGKYLGHAAIYVSQSALGINVYDQWVTGIPKPVHNRNIAWNGGPKVSNMGVKFFVVELK